MGTLEVGFYMWILGSMGMRALILKRSLGDEIRSTYVCFFDGVPV